MYSHKSVKDKEEKMSIHKYSINRYCLVISKTTDTTKVLNMYSMNSSPSTMVETYLMFHKFRSAFSMQFLKSTLRGN